MSPALRAQAAVQDVPALLVHFLHFSGVSSFGSPTAVQNIGHSALPSKAQLHVIKVHRRLAGLIEQLPQIAVNEDLLPQQRHPSWRSSSATPSARAGSAAAAWICPHRSQPHRGVQHPDPGCRSGAAGPVLCCLRLFHCCAVPTINLSSLSGRGETRQRFSGSRSAWMRVTSTSGHCYVST